MQWKKRDILQEFTVPKTIYATKQERKLHTTNGVATARLAYFVTNTLIICAKCDECEKTINTAANIRSEWNKICKYLESLLTFEPCRPDLVRNILQCLQTRDNIMSSDPLQHWTNISFKGFKNGGRCSEKCDTHYRYCWVLHFQ